MNTKLNLEGAAEPRLGVDIGRVIIDGSRHPYAGDTAFFDGDDQAVLATPEVPGAVASIARLVDLFAGRVWLISKCSPRVQARTLRWLGGHDFYRRTGLDPDHLRFCLARADKRSHCLDLGLTHFVDDRADVHAVIGGVVRWRYLFGSRHGRVPAVGTADVTAVCTWPDAERLITATLTAGAGGASRARASGRGSRPWLTSRPAREPAASG